jgi:hypothetical protein
MVSSPESFLIFSTLAQAVPGNFLGQDADGRRVTGWEDSHEARIAAHEMRQASRPKAA